MEKQGNQSHLPKVEKDDILSLVSEEIFDANHMERWEHFAHTNPTLAGEILSRAHIESTQSAHFDENRMQLQKRITDTVTFAIRALEVAALRKHSAPLSQEETMVVDVGGEDQQPSV
ncbi:MAG TPA: hypothetical protein VGO98_02170 [Candidatus Saccharimonadales bacterium]|jgi:hypothetical protein|nr:hypothetical protein [Candidatus Saccharibacteria bacterium]HEV7952155.1 hypothetical protein [Candidatus Saccharimonadales bacterium]